MKNFKKYSGIFLLIIFLIIKFQDSNFVKKIENISYDFFQSIFTVDTDFNNVVIVDIDEKSIGEIGQFPWRRDIFAKLINKLNTLDASIISFDIFFSEEDKQNPKRILEEFDIESSDVLDSDQSLYNEIQTSKIILPVLGDISAFNKNNNSKPKANIVTKGTNGFNYLYSFKNKITSLEKFNDAAQGIGNISYLDSQDGVLRSLPILLKIEDKVWPALSFETLRVLHENKTILVKSNENGISEIKTRKYKINTDANAVVFINYKNFDKKNYISAADILNDRINKNSIQNKIILIGSSAQGLFDFVKIPNGKVIPGVETHAHVIENIVNNDFIIKNFNTKIIENILLLISLIIVLIIPNKIQPKYSIVFYSGLLIILIVNKHNSLSI